MKNTPLTQSQAGIYYACQDIDGHSGNYQVPFLFHLPDSIDIEKLRKAIDAVVKAHPCLSSHVVTGEEGPMMEAVEFRPVAIREADDLDSVSDEFREVFDLDGETLSKFVIFRTGKGNFLFMNLHHIITDGSSIQVLFRDIDNAYSGNLPSVEEIGGDELAAAEAELRKSSVWKEERDWYLKEFGDCAEIDSQPVPSSNPTGKTGPVETFFRLSLTEDVLRGISDRFGIRQSLVFTAAWARMLADYTGDDKSFFTTIFHGRSDKRSANTVTMMVRTLPVYSEMPSGKSLADWFSELKARQDGTRERAVYSFSDIHQDLGLKGGITFAYQGSISPAEHPHISIGGIDIVGTDFRTPIPGTILNGQLIKTPGIARGCDYALKIAWDSALYTTEMISGMADCYSAIVKSMANAETIGDLAACSEEQEHWLDSLNSGILPHFDGESVAGLFERKAAQTPDAECCVFEGKRISYGQMKTMTDCLAGKIQALAAPVDGKPAVVSFICPRNELMSIIPIAIARTGCTYQPLDFSYPGERLNFMIKDAGASLLVCTEDYRGMLDGYDGPVLMLDGSDSLMTGGKPVLRKAAPDDCFALLYTSGSTGTPKGVMILQKNIRAMVHSHIKIMGLDGASRMTAYASYGFDAFMMDLWSSVCAGSSLHIISESIRYDLVAIKDYIDREKLTYAFMTTQVGTQMAVNFPEIETLKVLFVGGEKLVSIEPPSYRLVNGYGPTESLGYVSCYEVKGKDGNIPIGHATDTSRLYVVNKDGHRVPVGAAGELWIAGPQVAGGYLGQKEKTEASFIPNPFVRDGEDKAEFATVYRSGDIVRYREDGEIEFIGRKDGQVKVRGFRIELKEVEAVIREYPGIREVAVRAFDAEAGGKAIAAYVVADEKIDADKLGAFIGERKPPYMIPAVTMQIESIPLNVNGKVDVKKLPEPKMEIAQESAAGTLSAAPLNRLEEELMELTAGMTDCGSFSITTPLVNTGLTSISSLKLSLLLFKRYGVNVSSRELTHGATIQSVENAILEKLLSGEPRTVPEEKKADDAENFSAPLSSAQTGVYLECLKAPLSTVYNIPSVVTFPEEVGSEELRKAVAAAIGTHPILSASIDNSVDPPVQKVIGGTTAEVTVSEKSVEELRKDFVRPFDLSSGPLYRAVISGSTLLFDVHHLAMDGSSISLFLHQVCDGLEGRRPAPEECSYFQFAGEEQHSDISSAEKFFSSGLQGIGEATSIPADLHGNESAGKPAEAYVHTDHAAVEAFARKRGVTPAAVYLAALEYLAARYANSRETCICTVSSGRNDLRFSSTAGMFVNTVALVSRIGEQSVGDYLKEVSDNLSGSLEHENYPFARLSDKFGIGADIVFVYQLGLIDRFTVGGREVGMESLDLSAPKFKISLLVEERAGKVCLVSQYNDALYSAPMMDRLLESLNAVVTEMISDDAKPVKTVSIMSASQKKEVAGMNCPHTCPIEVRLFHRGMELWAEKHPDDLALIACDRTLTYREFDLAANGIANALLAKGLKKGDAVVVLLPRRSSTIACIFGIMKAGGAFIPCDPEYPTDRIKLIAEDSGAPFVVTTAELVSHYGDRGLLIDELASCDDCSKPGVEVLPEDLAYMIYTSGSTGKPKGVMVTHRNITTTFPNCQENNLHNMITRSRRNLSIATISFDAFVFDSGITLSGGRTLVFADENQAKDPVALTELMRRAQVDYLCCTSSRMLQYLDYPGFTECVKRCRCIVQGGEKFSPVLLRKLQQINPDTVILNGYGPTEISISCNAADLSHSDIVTVGKPQPNYTEWVLDKDGNELPAGVTGELCVGGEGVTQGYRNLPEKTAEKYVTYRGMRAFKTGDYARWLPSGDLEILGRTDNQVKLRGLRIELGEVESAIMKVEGVKDVLVKIVNLGGRDHLGAWFTADRKIDIDLMKAAIGKTLTSYMVPTAYLQLEAMPYTPNGKIDFRHLPEPAIVRSGAEFVAPAGEAESFFAKCFSDILGVEKVSATDSFFDLGGTSLVVMKLVIMAQKGNYPITYQDVFKSPTPRALAESVKAGAGTGADPDGDVRDYDYGRLASVLEKNRLESFSSDDALRPLGDVLLTGGTGFLGIHILRRLIEDHPESRIHCLLRSKHGIGAQERLLQMYFYYFEKDCSDLIGSRLFIHEGDVTAPISVEEHVDTVINCAALVKHFSKGDEIGEINVGGVRNCVDFCISGKARLIQISTYSVAGSSVNGIPKVDAFREDMLFMGQRIRNQYVHSKIMGERLILEAVAERGLDAKIMRVGNLSARTKDGEFQINAKANSFMGRLKIFQMLKALPYSSFPSPVEFSPIDETAAAICLLARTNSSCTVFHPYNSHFQMLGDVVSRMSVIGRDVRLVEDAEFFRILEEAKKDESCQESLSAMLAYESKDGGEQVRVIQADNSFTLQVLLRLGFRWSATSGDYVNQFLRQIDSLDYFDTK